MTIEEMKNKKKEYGFTNMQISVLSGVPLGTVQKIFGGATKAPRYETIEAIEKILNPMEAGRILYNHINDKEFTKHFVMEPAPAYKVNTGKKAVHWSSNGKIGNKTIEDYIKLPEGARVELIDGNLYDMAAPTTLHQKIAAEILYLFESFIRTNDGPCVPFIAPTDVQLDCDDKTMVQPDVFVVCDREKIRKARVFGAPDFAIEVVSPSNWNMDMSVKLNKYKAAGVREYWTVSPEQNAINVYEFEKGDLPCCYTFDDKVPVGIWNGRCEVDFKEIYKRLKFMFEMDE